jgi:subtilisin family serine protease
VAAQRPTVSPSLARADSTVTVWLFVRAQHELAHVRALVADAGGRVRHTSTWLHAVSATLPPTGLEAARRSPLLRHVQPVTRFRRPTVAPATPLPFFALAAADSGFGPSASPLRTLNVFPVIERGFRGAGVRIALLDTGFETELPDFAGATIVAQHDFVFDDSIVRNEIGDDLNASAHGTAVWSLLAGRRTDTLLGIAPDAEYLLAKTEDVRSETTVEEDHFVAALEWADSLGAHIVSSSLGYVTFDGGAGYTFSQLNGDIAVTTVAADLAAARGILVVTSIGNGGPATRSLTTPADGDSVLAVGAVDTLGNLAAFSGRGPTADGRIKPDLLAPGVDLLVRFPPGYARSSGTSLSTPLIAGIAALIKEANPLLGPMDLMTALQSAGSRATRPDTIQGYGIPDAFASVVFPGGLVIDRPSDSVLTSVTPILLWHADGVPAFALPITFRIEAGSDSALATPRLDTIVAIPAVTLPYVLRPGDQLFYRVTATGADSATLTRHVGTALIGPAWVRLDVLDDPAGRTIRDLRPAFRWIAPSVSAAAGPFRFRVEVFRETDDVVEILADSLTETEWVPPRNLERNTPYRWRVTAFLDGDSVVALSRGPFLIVDDSTPPLTTLFQNFPNPFPNASIGQATTCIWFDLASDGVVQLDILDVRGLVMRRMLPGGPYGPFFRAGRYGRTAVDAVGRCDPQLEWDGRTDGGSTVPPGIYLARLITPNGSFVKRIVFLGLP